MIKKMIFLILYLFFVIIYCIKEGNSDFTLNDNDYNLQGNDTDCPEQCKECVSENNCTVCKERNHYGIENCSFICSENCLDKEDENPICNINDGDCIECKDGFYGKKCNEVCSSGCIKCEKESGLCLQCKIGFYLDDTEKTCKQCSENCSECYNATTCSKCKTRYHYGKICENECSKNCRDIYPEGRLCDMTSGSCYECKDKFYGMQCQDNCKDSNCKICSQLLGICEECDKNYYLTLLHVCEECPDNCLDKKCTKSGCDDCKELTLYGKFCEYDCPQHCNFTDKTKRKCEKENGKCITGCDSENFEPPTCEECKKGKFGENCTNECNKHCTMEKEGETLQCRKSDGACEKCLSGYWFYDCSKECDINCDVSKINCGQNFGECTYCKLNYYLLEGKCLKCPENCKLGCDKDDCEECREGYYGHNCNETCSNQCYGNKCDKKSGFCNEGCKQGYFDDKCDKECKGCLLGCKQNNGNCINIQCRENYKHDKQDRNKCNKQCNTTCVNSACDSYTGECLFCNNSKWGDSCQFPCSDICKDDKRIDCCYAYSKSWSYPHLTLQNSYFDNRLDTEYFDKYSQINLILGRKKINMTILVDFFSNSPLVIFDNYYKVNKTYGNINISSNFDSNESKTKIINISETEAKFHNLNIKSKIQGTDYICLVNSQNKTVSENFTFLIGEEVIADANFNLEKGISGVIGLGFINSFMQEVYTSDNKLIEKFIMTRFKNDRNINLLFGDYSPSIKDNFIKTTTMLIKDNIPSNKNYEITTMMRGFTYYLKKAYINENIITMSTNVNTILNFPSSLELFFEKMYFAKYYKNGCSSRRVNNLKEYYCKPETISKISSKFGIVIDDYIYYLSKEFLFKRNSEKNEFIFQIRLTDNKPNIILGIEFFDEYEVVFNYGNNTLNFLGDTKKLNINLTKIPDDWPTNDYDKWMTPGRLTIILATLASLFVIIIYIIHSYANKKKNKRNLTLLSGMQ